MIFLEICVPLGQAFIEFIYEIFKVPFTLQLVLFLADLIGEYEQSERVQVRHVLHQLVALEVQLCLTLVDELGFLADN